MVRQFIRRVVSFVHKYVRFEDERLVLVESDKYGRYTHPCISISNCFFWFILLFMNLEVVKLNLPILIYFYTSNKVMYYELW